MRLGYLDMFSGVSGDMLLGACLDAGVEIAELSSAIDALDLDDVSISVESVERHGIAATRCVVDVPDLAGHRPLDEILARIKAAGLSPSVTAKAKRVFERLGAAEARVHDVPIEKVHFHEVGALDAIVDIVGSVWCLEKLGIDRLHASRFTLGSGWVDSAHGRLPIPPPAVLGLIDGWRAIPGDVAAELTTPTGAAIVTTLAEPGWPADFMPDSTGYGAGSATFDEQPNLLRLILGRAEAPATTIDILETDLDDLDPRLYGPLTERLYGAGAVEVHRVPIQMKKDRPGVTVRVLAPSSSVEGVIEALFAETTTIGVRRWRAMRTLLERETIEVETSWGRIAAKRVHRRDGRTELRPEFDACREIAERRGLPVRDVVDAVSREMSRLEPDPDPAV